MTAGGQHQATQGSEHISVLLTHYLILAYFKVHVVFVGLSRELTSLLAIRKAIRLLLN